MFLYKCIHSGFGCMTFFTYDMWCTICYVIFDIAICFILRIISASLDPLFWEATADQDFWSFFISQVVAIEHRRVQVFKVKFHQV